MDPNKLPQKILVKIIHNKKSGVWIAELPELDLYTEADSERELDFCINDLIFSYFDTPDTVRNLIRYSPQSVRSKDSETHKSEVFLKFFSPDARYLYS